MKRIYIKNPQAESVILDEKQEHYLRVVLRLLSGDQIEILSEDELLTAELIEVSKRKVSTAIISRRPLIKPAYNFTVHQCLLKREYMDTVVEKYSELGVTRIVPVISERSLPSLKEGTIRRFGEIAVNAALQSRQEFVPEIAVATPISSIQSESTDKLLFYECADRGLPMGLSSDVDIIIGPEGGFTESEVNSLVNKGYTVCSPFSSILKAETAAVVFAGWVRIVMG